MIDFWTLVVIVGIGVLWMFGVQCVLCANLNAIEARLNRLEGDRNGRTQP